MQLKRELPLAEQSQQTRPSVDSQERLLDDLQVKVVESVLEKATGWALALLHTPKM